MTSTRNPYDTDQIPDRWQVTHDPRNRHKEDIQLAYNTAKHTPYAIISIEAINTEGDYGKTTTEYFVEAQDKNGNNSPMGTLLPLEYNDSFEDRDRAEEELLRLANEYPLTISESKKDWISILSEAKPKLAITNFGFLLGIIGGIGGFHAMGADVTTISPVIGFAIFIGSAILLNGTLIINEIKENMNKS